MAWNSSWVARGASTILRTRGSRLVGGALRAPVSALHAFLRFIGNLPLFS
ncbi:MAG: hypothetical protein IT425_00660 [Pirellulales bacterium]|nr:hypothetical protein [Pirellulales bacterium]